MSKAAGKTGTSPTVLIAIEQFFSKENRILDDPLSVEFLRGGIGVMLRLFRVPRMRDWMVAASEKTAPGLYGGILCRKRYIDDKLTKFIADMDAVVNLGAGLDTRLYRPEFAEKLPAWELDQPDNINAKQRIIGLALGSLPKMLTLVPIDFDTQDIRHVIHSAGYTSDKITFFIWEAVTQYLTREGLRSTFEFLSGAKSGSRIVFTYVRKKFINGQELFNWPAGYKRFVKSGLWKFGEEPEYWPSFLEPYGWKVEEDVEYGQLADIYIKPSGRILLISPVERILFAKKL